MALKGTLKDFNLADIFQLIGIQRKTGVLTLKSNEEVATVSFVNGEVVAADSLHRRLEDRLGTVLVKSGRITEIQLQEALKIQKNTLKRMGHVLVESSFISAEDLRDALQIQISQMIYRLFRWRDAEYNFSQEERVEYDEENVVPMSAESVLMEGARILDEWPMIEKAIKSFKTVLKPANIEIVSTDAVPGKEGEPEDEGDQAVRLSQEERAIFALIDGKRNIQEIVERSTVSEFDTCRVLYELLGRQIIEEMQAPGQRARPAPAPVVQRDVSPVLIGVGYLFLIVLLGGSTWYRSRAFVEPSRGDEKVLGVVLAPVVDGRTVDEIVEQVAFSRLQRVEFAMEVYYLLNRGYPTDLGYLVTAKLLRPDEIRDPGGRPFRYEIAPEGYRLWIRRANEDPVVPSNPDSDNLQN